MFLKSTKVFINAEFKKLGFTHWLVQKNRHRPKRSKLQLWKIQSCFRVLKTNLDARPVFVWPPEHIRGHFLICYLALVLERIGHLKVSKAGLDLSEHEIINSLEKAKLLAVNQPKGPKTLYRVHLQAGIQQKIARKETP